VSVEYRADKKEQLQCIAFEGYKNAGQLAYRRNVLHEPNQLTAADNFVPIDRGKPSNN
jgi:hypothetical protein